MRRLIMGMFDLFSKKEKSKETNNLLPKIRKRMIVS